MDWEAYVSAVRFIDGLDRGYVENLEVGWLYVMRNKEFRKPLLKIGMTRRPPHDRAAELAGTGVPGAFQLVYFVHVGDVRMAETFAHQALAKYRYQENKEFFEAPIGLAVSVLDQISATIPVLRSQRNRGSRNPRSKPLPQAFSSVVRPCPRCGTKNRVRTLAIPIAPRCASCSHEMPPA